MAKESTALVTGGNKGIGLEICRQLAQRGFLVFLAARNRDAGLRATAELQKEKAKVQFVPLDVTSPESIKQAVREVEQVSDHLDVLINNAAIMVEEDRDILKTDGQLLLKTIGTNVLGPLRVAQAFWPLVAKSDAGRIINVSSGAGALFDMEADIPAYSISKTALNAVTRQLAAALKNKGITVNSVTPGWVKTDMGGENAPRTVEEGAAGIVWLATEASHDLTGQFFRDREINPW